MNDDLETTETYKSSGDKVQDPAEPQSQETDHSATVKKRKSKANVLLIVLFFLLAALIVSALVYFLNNDMNNEGDVSNEGSSVSSVGSESSEESEKFESKVSKDESSSGNSSSPSSSSPYVGTWIIYRISDDTATKEYLKIYDDYTMDFYADGKLLYVGTWSVDLSGVLKFEFKEDGKDYYLEYKLKDDKIFSYDSEDPTNLSSFYGIKS